MIARFPGRSRTQRIVHRVLQARHHIEPRNEAVSVPPALVGLMTVEVANRFAMLNITDQEHLINVAGRLQDAGANDDLVTAGLLHDIGKFAPGVTIRVTDRVARVTLGHLAPASMARLAQRPLPPRRWSALWVLSRHARISAELVGQARYNARVQWLIANHERQGPFSDPDLLLLIAVDEDNDL